MPYHLRDLRKRKRGYSGSKPIQCRWTHPHDPRLRREKSFATKTLARQWGSQQDADAGKGVWIDPTAGTLHLEEVADAWYKASLRRWQESTAAGVRSDLNAWIAPPEGRTVDSIGRAYPLSGRRVNTLTATELQRWRDQIAEKRSLRTARKQFATLSAILTYAVRQKYIPSNPAKSVEPLRAAPAKTREYGDTKSPEGEAPADPLLVLEPHEIKRLATAFAHEPYRVAIEFDAWMGLRAGELWRLERQDFNLLAGTVTVNKAFKEIRGKLHEGPPKSKAAYRTLKMPAPILVVMKRHLASGWVGTEPNALVFTTVTGKPIRHNGFYSDVYKPTVRRVLPHKAKLRFHDLRHTAASLLLSVTNGNLVVVKQRLGHEKLQTTVDIYGKLLPHADEDHMVALERLYDRPASAVVVRELRPAAV